MKFFSKQRKSSIPFPIFPITDLTLLKKDQWKRWHTAEPFPYMYCLQLSIDYLTQPLIQGILACNMYLNNMC